MNEQKTYNGWANYATWGVALVLDNDQGTQEYVQERVADIIRARNAAGDTGEQPFYSSYIADFLEDFTKELCGLGDNELGITEPSLMAQQLLGAAFSDVDWREIADHYIADQDANDA